ncbi:MAG: hypothetical protein WCD76_12550 [Pyrinomonadaceae bacterium]
MQTFSQWTSGQHGTARSRITRGVCRAALAIGMLFLVAGATFAQTSYVGAWREGQGGKALFRFDNWEDFVDKWQELRKVNVHLRDIETVEINDDLNYVGTWVEGQGDDALYLYDNWDGFVAKWKELHAKGMRLIDVEMVNTGEGMRFIGVWGDGKDEPALIYVKSWAELVAKWNEFSTKNLRLIDISAARVGNETHYVGVWTAGGGKQPLYQTDSWDEFVAKWKELSNQGLRLIDIETLRVNGKTTYYGVWESGKDDYSLFQFNNWDDFVAKWKELNGKNQRLIDIAAADMTPPPPKGKPAQHGKPAQGSGTGKPLYLDFTADSMKKDPVTGISFPAEMPPIVWPTFNNCKAGFGDDKLRAQKAWAMGHYNMWRAYQLITYIEARSWTEDLWNHGYVASAGKDNWSPRAWFGPFADKLYRYQTVRDAVIMAWNDRFLGKRYTFTIQCRNNEGGIHPCNLKNPGTDHTPSANHIVLGKINLCDRFFDEERGDTDRARVMVHEIFHHLAPKGLFIIDEHTHSDFSGWCKTTTDKMYGSDDALHLANSKGCWNSSRIHNEIAARNNDNYALFITSIGSAVYSGKLTRFPAASFFDTHK